MKIPFVSKFFIWYRSQAPLWIPKPKRGEYVWKATVYKYKIFNNAEDIPVHVEHFVIAREAETFKKAIKAGVHGNFVRITKVSVADEDGYVG